MKTTLIPLESWNAKQWRDCAVYHSEEWDKQAQELKEAREVIKGFVDYFDCENDDTSYLEKAREFLEKWK